MDFFGAGVLISDLVSLSAKYWVVLELLSKGTRRMKRNLPDQTGGLRPFVMTLKGVFPVKDKCCSKANHKIKSF